MSRTAKVKNLRAGQRFIWCGRVVTFERAQDHRTGRTGKKRRRLIVADGDTTHALWYDDREDVTLVETDG